MCGITTIWVMEHLARLQRDAGNYLTGKTTFRDGPGEHFASCIHKLESSGVSEESREFRGGLLAKRRPPRTTLPVNSHSRMCRQQGYSFEFASCVVVHSPCHSFFYFLVGRARYPVFILPFQALRVQQLATSVAMASGGQSVLSRIRRDGETTNYS